ncbi:MAG: DNA polymerase III subunit gamma/tau [Bacillota bacterium]
MYTALYRKWRPRSFDDVYGQEQVTITLKNEILNNKISHAYLFCGTRGTGKTTSAKLLAKAVNCRSPRGYNPCDECESCVSINDGNSIDVFEIDAASNRGIDDIRNLREAIKFTPTLGKYKVYIIDEVHMLTNEAFNALLKTLEEPPEYVLFILATTEPHKLPATILSRCQRFDFKRISVENIIERLRYVCDKEKIDIEDSAIRLIARNSDGAMRDALSILDQCSVFSNKRILYDEVLEVLGIVNNEFLFSIGEAVLFGDASKAVLLINELASGGKDINQFIRDLTLHYRNLLMTKVVDKTEDVIDMSMEGIELLKKHAQEYDKDNIIRCINILSELESEAKWSSHPRILLEVAVVKMCKLINDSSYEGLLARLSKLETAVTRGQFTVDSDEPLVTAELSLPKTESKPLQIKKSKPREQVNSISEILHKWSGFIQELKNRGKIKLRTYLVLAKPVRFENDIIVLSYTKEDIYCKEAIEMPAVKADVETAASEYFGRSIRVKCIFENESPDIDSEAEEIDIVKAAMELAGQDKVEVVEE